MVPAILDGRLVRSPVQARRLACSGCGHVVTQRFASETSAVQEHVRDLATRIGPAAASVTLGCDQRTVASHLARWVTIRETDLAAFRPRILAVATTRLSHTDHVVLIDADVGSLLDVTVDHASAARWLSQRPGAVDTAFVDVDPRSLHVVRSVLPETRIAVAPRDATRAVGAAAMKSFRRWTRSGASSIRNDREAADLVCRPDMDMNEAERDTVTSFWPREAKAFRRCVLNVLDQIGAGTTMGCLKVIGSATETIDRLAPGCSLVLLLRNWGDLFAEGAGQTWADTASRTVREMTGSVRSVLGRPSFNVVRILLTFCDVDRDPRGGLSLNAICDRLAAVSRDGPSTSRLETNPAGRS